MTISSAIKRLQLLEDQYGGHVELVSLFDDDEPGFVRTEKDLVIDVIPGAKPKTCAIMPLMYWETIVPKGLDYKQV